MKYLNKALLAGLALCFGAQNINAQDESNPWAIGLGTNFIDFYPTGYSPESAIPDDRFGSFGEDFFNHNHYNDGPILSRLTVGRHITKGLSLELAGSLNTITVIGEEKLDERNELDHYALDLSAKWAFLYKKDNWFDPYVTAGLGNTWIDSKSEITMNAGLGINFWINENIGINVQTAYKAPFDDNNVIPHFQHAAGLVLQVGGTDTDGDGIVDKKDRCPEVPGSKENQGCPDTDGDGVIDIEDACPELVGPAENNGCPDTDGDGVVDPKDACPEVAGPVLKNGCPDADDDGVFDHQDDCPEVAGPAENRGCPWPDADNDGVFDKDDECPEIAGTVANNGCPEVTEEVAKKLNSYAETIQFKSGTDNLQAASEAVLTDIVGILNEYPTANFTIEGHTDSSGSEAFNQKLSEKRAKSVENYLTSHGVAASRLSAAGYGESKPIAPNNTRAGREKNRRVEINLKK